MENRRILGIDPGTANTGYAVLECGTDPPTLIAYGMIRTTPKDGTVRERIDFIGQEIEKVIAEYQPDIFAIEDFTEQGTHAGKQYKEMAWLTEHFRMLGRQLGFEVLIFKNAEWKKKTLGIGRATKKQVMHFVNRNIRGAQLLKGKPDHVWDSAGVAYCASLVIQ